MKRFIYKIASLFILDKQKRKDFRKKYFHIFADRKYGKNLTCLNPLNSLKAEIIQSINYHARVANLHQQSFAGYKNKYQGKDMVILGTGPSLKNYKPINNAIHVGLNKAVLYDAVKLDYLFVQDYTAADYLHSPPVDSNTNLKRFYGLLSPNINPTWVIPESLALKHNATRYYARPILRDGYTLPKTLLSYDLQAEELVCYGSVAFPAMQFILYTNPKTIYIVGCDSSYSGYFYDDSNHKKQPPILNHLLYGWQQVKKFAQIYYPDTEIISINPVGLKGLFKDEHY